MVGEEVWSPWLRAGCGKRRGVPGKASSRDAVCPQLVTLFLFIFQLNCLGAELGGPVLTEVH